MPVFLYVACWQYIDGMAALHLLPAMAQFFFDHFGAEEYRENITTTLYTQHT